MTDLHTRLTAAVDARLTKTRQLLVYAQQNSLTLADPRWLGREVPGWHEWPDVEALAEWAIAICERDQQILHRHRPCRCQPDGAGGPPHCFNHCRVRPGRPWCPEITDMAAAYGIEVNA